MIWIGFSEANPFELNLPQKSSPKVNIKTVISKRTARNYKQKYTVITNEQITPQERSQFQPAKPKNHVKFPHSPKNVINHKMCTIYLYVMGQLIVVNRRWAPRWTQPGRPWNSAFSSSSSSQPPTPSLPSSPSSTSRRTSQPSDLPISPSGIWPSSCLLSMRLPVAGRSKLSCLWLPSLILSISLLVCLCLWFQFRSNTPLRA